MTDEVSLRPVSGPVDVRMAIPGSKSITNRALVLAALSQGRSRLSALLRSDDTAAMADSLGRLGFRVTVDWERRAATVEGGAGRIPAAEADVFCAEAATVTRFLLAACALGRGVYRFDARGAMRRRPIGPLVGALERLGAAFEPAQAETLPVTLRASGLRGGELALDASVSSQFASAVLMAAPYAERGLGLNLRGGVSRPYIELTLALMREFGVDVSRECAGRWRVAPGPYRGADLTVEADASTASYFFAAAAASAGQVTVTNLRRRESRQADVRFLDVLERMGCAVESGDDGTTVRGPRRLRGVDVDMTDFSDTFMTLACLAPLADGPTTIRGIAHTKVKESDRVACTLENLGRLGIRAEETGDGITVHPGTPRGGVVESFADHRQAMSLSVLSLVTPGVTIRGARSVDKTCPEFFDLWASLEAR